MVELFWVLIIRLLGLNISYEDIQNQRNKDSEENLDNFLKDLIKIPNIKEKLEKLLKK